MRKVYFVVGIKSNLAPTLKSAIDYAREHGADTGIIDIHKLVPAWANYGNDWNSLQEEVKIDVVPDRESLRSTISRVSREDAVLVFLFLPDRQLRFITRRLIRTGAKSCFMTVGPVPSSESRGLNPEESFLTRIRRSVTGLFKASPDYWVVSGQACLEMYRSFFGDLSSTVMVPAHSIDYERFRKLPDSPAEAGESIVFLDQGWHSKPPPQYVTDGTYPPIGLEEYREKIRVFLDRIGSQLGGPVIVSAHPKASKEITGQIFEGFDLRYGDTAPLVREATLVVGHSSTSIQFAVMAGVPVLLFTCKALRNSQQSEMLMAGYRDTLAAPVADLDNPASVDHLLPALKESERDLQVKFVRSYVRHPQSPNLDLWDAVFSRIL